MLSLVESIRHARTVALVEKGIVNSGPHNAANNRGEDRHHEIVVGRAEDFSSIHDGREKSGAQISSGVDSLEIISLTDSPISII